ncbi:MAG TPA: OmpH family outer membrane protein [Flavipsychrobacter sp.]|nr:OmpH family outer membrane protein [Flavipsychrobacter sp.]
MKNIATILSALALAGVLVLFLLHFSGNKGNATSPNTSSLKADAGSFRVAYVDIDTFEANYDFLKSKREEFNKRQTGMQSELERSAQQFQSRVADFQRKVQSNSITQAEGEATQKQLAQMQQSLQLREQALTEQLLKEKDAFNQKLHDDLNSFLEDYNKSKGYDYILSYSQVGSQILLANKKLNITADVIKGMNERAKKTDDTTKKK